MKLKNNSALAIAAGCAVVFMLIVTIVSIVIFQRRVDEASALLQDTAYSEYDYYVVMITSEDYSDFWQQVYESAKLEGESKNIYVDMLSENMNMEYSKRELLEMAIDARVDGILLEGDDSEETASLLAKAKNNGITVVTLQQDVDTDSRVSYVAVNNYSIASLYGEALAQNLTTEKNIMIINGAGMNEEDTIQMMTSIREYLGESDLDSIPEFTLKTIDEDGTFATEEYVQSLFKENDLAPVVICLDEVSTACFYQAMIDYNMVGQIKLFGYYQSDTILTGIKQQVVQSSVTVDTSGMGIAAVDAYLEYASSGYVSDYISVDAVMINYDNVDGYIEGVEDE